MSTIVVWVLIMSFNRGPAVVDNIASEAECQALITGLKASFHEDGSRLWGAKRSRSAGMRTGPR